jgi:hypothetical protein
MFNNLLRAPRTMSFAPSPQRYAPQKRTYHQSLDDYDPTNFVGDPFRTPTPEPEHAHSPSRKRKDHDDDGGLGIDEEVAVTKRPRIPNVKLDETKSANPFPSHILPYHRTRWLISR